MGAERHHGQQNQETKRAERVADRAADHLAEFAGRIQLGDAEQPRDADGGAKCRESAARERRHAHRALALEEDQPRPEQHHAIERQDADSDGPRERAHEPEDRIARGVAAKCVIAREKREHTENQREREHYERDLLFGGQVAAAGPLDRQEMTHRYLRIPTCLRTKAGSHTR